MPPQRLVTAPCGAQSTVSSDDRARQDQAASRGATTTAGFRPRTARDACALRGRVAGQQVVRPALRCKHCMKLWVGAAQQGHGRTHGPQASAPAGSRPSHAAVAAQPGALQALVCQHPATPWHLSTGRHARRPRSGSTQKGILATGTLGASPQRARRRCGAKRIAAGPSSATCNRAEDFVAYTRSQQLASPSGTIQNGDHAGCHPPPCGAGARPGVQASP